MAFDKQAYDDAYAKEFLDRITIKARKDSGFLTMVDEMAEKMNMSRQGFIMHAVTQYVRMLNDADNDGAEIVTE